MVRAGITPPADEALGVVMVTRVVGTTTPVGATVAGLNKFKERLTQRRLAQPNGRELVAGVAVMVGRAADGGATDTAGRMGVERATDGRVVLGGKTVVKGRPLTPMLALPLADPDTEAVRVEILVGMRMAVVKAAGAVAVAELPPAAGQKRPTHGIETGTMTGKDTLLNTGTLAGRIVVTPAGNDTPVGRDKAVGRVTLIGTEGI